MKIAFYGGFGEKGRTSFGIESREAALIFDVGINTNVSPALRDYYPAISPEQLKRQTAILLSHAHEDHIGALSWCFANGFSGQLFMTRETEAEAREMVASYDSGGSGRKFELPPIHAIAPGDEFRVGDFVISTGRSGHAVGGVWYAISHGLKSLLYCGDVVPDSAVVAMDQPNTCDVMIFDASYGTDAVGWAERAGQIAAWTQQQTGPCLLPTPLAGRSLELILALPGPVAIDISMREPLLRQIADARWLRPGIAATLRARIDASRDWSMDRPFPSCPLLVHDAMGISGPSVEAITRAVQENIPILLTGHMPTGTPVQILHEKGRANWIRLPTHPTLPENLALLRACSPRIAIPHSCGSEDVERLRQRLPDMMRPYRTGEGVNLAP